MPIVLVSRLGRHPVMVMRSFLLLVTLTAALAVSAPAQIPFDESERHPSPNAYALSKYLSEVIADSLASSEGDPPA